MSARKGSESADTVRRREAERELRLGLFSLVAGLVMVGLFYGLSLEVQYSPTGTGWAGLPLIAYWLLGPAGVLLAAAGALFSVTSWAMLQRP